MAKDGKNRDFDYFEYFNSCADYICRAAEYLDDSIRHFQHETFFDRVGIMHKIENDADSGKHTMMTRLAHEFLPPIEREDIIALSGELDNVVDMIDDVMLRIYMFNAVRILPGAEEFTGLIVKTAHKLKETVAEFKNFKNSKSIRDKIVAVNTMESDGDALHARCLHELFSSDTGAKELMVWTFIFDELEDCLDAAEHVVDIIETVIMKNS